MTSGQPCKGYEKASDNPRLPGCGPGCSPGIDPGRAAAAYNPDVQDRSSRFFVWSLPISHEDRAEIERLRALLEEANKTIRNKSGKSPNMAS